QSVPRSSASLVGRSVVYNDYAPRPHRLAQQTVQGIDQRGLLIVRRNHNRGVRNTRLLPYFSSSQPRQPRKNQEGPEHELKHRQGYKVGRQEYQPAFQNGLYHHRNLFAKIRSLSAEGNKQLLESGNPRFLGQSDENDVRQADKQPVIDDSRY